MASSKRRIQAPASDIASKDLIQQVNPGPGHRSSIQQGQAFRPVQPSHTYRQAELYDKHGNPVRITAIPDKTKGAPTYGGYRTPLSKQVITEQVFDVAKKMFKGGVSFDEQNADWVVVHGYELPSIWHSIVKTTDLLIVFPTEYPELPPVGFYLREDIPLSVNGHLYKIEYHDACSDPLTQGWKWYCVYINQGSWRPAPVKHPGDWRQGDNLWTYFALIAEVLSGEDE